MCLKHYYIHVYCGHAADPNLTWTKPCDKALNDQDYSKLTKFCDQKNTQTVNHTLSIRFCPTCALNPTNFLTEDRIAYKSAAKERALQRHTMDVERQQKWKARKMSEKKYLGDDELRVPRMLRQRKGVVSGIALEKGDGDAIPDDWQSFADDDDDAREKENKDDVPGDWQELADKVSDFESSVGDVVNPSCLRGGGDDDEDDDDKQREDDADERLVARVKIDIEYRSGRNENAKKEEPVSSNSSDNSASKASDGSNGVGSTLSESRKAEIKEAAHWYAKASAML